MVEVAGVLSAIILLPQARVATWGPGNSFVCRLSSLELLLTDRDLWPWRLATALSDRHPLFAPTFVTAS